MPPQNDDRLTVRIFAVEAMHGRGHSRGRLRHTGAHHAFLWCELRIWDEKAVHVIRLCTGTESVLVFCVVRCGASWIAPTRSGRPDIFSWDALLPNRSGQGLYGWEK